MFVLHFGAAKRFVVRGPEGLSWFIHCKHVTKTVWNETVRCFKNKFKKKISQQIKGL